MRRLLPLFLLVAACSDDGTSVVSADAGACLCRAIGVAYDRASSMLGATNVQDAIDELAARPLPEAPIGTRIKTIVQVFPNPGTMGGVGQTLSCPDPKHDIALGGACGLADTAQLVETRINNDATNASYSCGWVQPSGGTASMRVTVVCLTQAR